MGASGSGATRRGRSDGGCAASCIVGVGRARVAGCIRAANRLARLGESFRAVTLVGRAGTCAGACPRSAADIRPELGIAGGARRTERRPDVGLARSIIAARGRTRGVRTVLGCSACACAGMEPARR